MTQQDEKRAWGGDGLDPEDMALPEIKLVQNVGGDMAKASGAEPGDFYCSLTDEVIKGDKGLEMVIVAMQKNRTYWGRADISDEPPECASLAVVKGGGTSINGENCAECEHRNDTPWLLSAAERREKCLLNYNVLGINMEGLPLLLRASGISSLPAKELYTQLSLNRVLRGEWYKAKVSITSVPKKTASGDAFAIRFGKLELIKDEALLKEMKFQSFQLLGTQIGLPAAQDDTKLTTPEAPEAKKPEPTEQAKKPEAKKLEEEPPVEEVDTSF